MKKIYRFILCASIALLSVACNNQAEQSVEMAENEGVLALSIDFEGTRADVDPTAEFELKIYRYAADNSKELVRKYTKLTDIPEYIWLIKDNYCAQVKVGTKTLASFTDKYYTGTADFAITAGSVESVTVDCQMVNIPVAVAYDTTVGAQFTGEYYTYVSAANSFDLEAAKSAKVPTLKYTDSTEGYFILPDGTTNISWYFYGTDGQTPLTASGVIENVEAQKRYTLKFKYSKDAPGGLTLVATVDTSVEHRDDSVAFSPDPTVKGVGFDASAPCDYVSGTRSYTIAALDTISQLNITYGDTTYDLINTTYGGIAVTKVSAKEYSVALSEAFFATLNGGAQTIAFRIKDASGGVGYQECTCFIEGILPLESYDLWFSTANFSAYCYISEGITIGYRVAGGEWAQLPVTASGVENLYNATATDFAAATTYEYALFENGVQLGLALSITTPAGTQIPAAGFEEWSTASDKAVCPAADPYALYWDTGNHATASLVGSQLTVSSTDVRPGSTGVNSAYMKSIKAAVMGIGKFAAGNLFTGTFAMNGLDGIVTFGRDFNFTARPASLSFWMKNNEGTINEGSHASGSDIYTIMVIITDGTTYAVNTKDESSFLKVDQLADTKGVIGYGYISGSDSRAEWTQETINITYVESMKSVKPKKIVVSFTPSGYGDYFCGSTSSWMYVDDIELVY